jgi:hypothetical protein
MNELELKDATAELHLILADLIKVLNDSKTSSKTEIQK